MLFALHPLKITPTRFWLVYATVWKASLPSNIPILVVYYSIFLFFLCTISGVPNFISFCFLNIFLLIRKTDFYNLTLSSSLKYIYITFCNSKNIENFWVNCRFKSVTIEHLVCFSEINDWSKTKMKSTRTS